MGQIQTFKNSRIVGENRSGLLTIVRLPPGDYGQQVEQAVAAENADRTALMQAEAAARSVPLATVEAEQAASGASARFPASGSRSSRTAGVAWVQKQARVATAGRRPRPSR